MVLLNLLALLQPLFSVINWLRKLGERKLEVQILDWPQPKYKISTWPPGGIQIYAAFSIEITNHQPNAKELIRNAKIYLKTKRFGRRSRTIERFAVDQEDITKLEIPPQSIPITRRVKAHHIFDITLHIPKSRFLS